MKPEDTRKYLPAEGYRFLALSFLAACGETGATKGEILWATRANHYMITRVLRALNEESLIVMDGDARVGFRIRISGTGHAFLIAHRDYFHAAFGRTLRDHFRIGPWPEWLSDSR